MYTTICYQLWDFFFRRDYRTEATQHNHMRILSVIRTQLPINNFFLIIYIFFIIIIIMTFFVYFNGHILQRLTL